MLIRTDGVYIVTGGAGAAASSIASVFHEAGARLVLADLDERATAARADPIGAVAVAADLTRPDGATAVVEAALAVYGRVDGLIHTAGGFQMAPAHLSDPALYDRLFDLNVRTLVNATRAVLPHLIAQRDGFLAAFSAGIVVAGGGEGMTVYAAAKAAVSQYLRALEREVRASGVRVAIVYPLTAIDTPRNRQEMPDVDPATWIDPDEIAAALLMAATRGPRGRLTELAIGVRG